MRKHYLKFILLATSFGFCQVGIGTTTPLETLHLAESNSTIRIESLNTINNGKNNGTELAPVYVDKDGELTLTAPVFTGAGSAGSPLNFIIDIPNFVPDNLSGFSAPNDKLGRIITSDNTNESIEGFIYSVPFTTPQSCVVEIKHSISVILSGTDLAIPSKTYISDGKTRTLQTFFCFDIGNDGLSPAEKAIKYGFQGQFYASNTGGITGYPYLNSHGYATLPPGTHSIHFFAIVSDPPSTFTSIGFGGSLDFLKIRVYN
jgi:hypothetical protein